MIKLSEIQEYVKSNKEILEEVINKEQTFLKTIPQKSTRKNATKSQALEAALEGRKLAEEICNYKLTNTPEVKINYVSLDKHLTRVGQVVLGIFTSTGIAGIVDTIANSQTEGLPEAIVLTSLFGTFVAGCEHHISKLKEFNDGYNFGINEVYGNTEVTLPRDSKEALVIGSSHEHTHAIIAEKNKIRKGGPEYHILSEGLSRTVEKITAQIKFEEENNYEFLRAINFLSLSELKSTYQEICKLQKSNPKKSLITPTSNEEKRRMKVYQNLDILSDSHLMGSTLGSIECEKKGQQAIYDMLNLKIGN